MATAAQLTPQQQQQQLMQQDALLATQVLQTATEYYIRGQSSNAPLGQAISLSLPTTGIMTGADLHIKCTLDITAAATANPVGAAGIITNVTTTDWYGNARTNTSGSRLQSLNGYHIGRPYNKVASSLSHDTANALYDLPTAVASSVDLDFWLHVPFSANPNSLVGALLTQTSNGTCQINLQTIANLVSATNPLAPYSAGTLTAANVYVTPYWRFLMPVSFAPNTLPEISLSTAYSIQDVQTPQNLAVGVDNLTNFPAARVVHSVLLDVVNGSSMSFGSDLNNIAVITNGATPVRFWNPFAKLVHQRNLLGADDIPGRYYLPFVNDPINTQVFGSYQLQVNPNTVNSGAFLVMSSEMTYAMGVPLPGLSV